MTTRRGPEEIRAEIAWVLKSSRLVAGALVCVALLALLFTMVNATLFAVDEGVPWFIAWLLDPMASITLGSMILAEGVLARHEHRSGAWAFATKWFAGLATWAMNVWSSVVAGSAAGILLHSVAPGLVLGLAEAAPRVRRRFAGVVARLEGELASVEAQSAAERVAARDAQARADRDRQEAQRRLTRQAEIEAARHQAELDAIRRASRPPGDDQPGTSVTRLPKRRTTRGRPAEVRQEWIERQLRAGVEVSGPDVKAQFPDAANAARDVARVKSRLAQQPTARRGSVHVV